MNTAHLYLFIMDWTLASQFDWKQKTSPGHEALPIGAIITDMFFSKCIPNTLGGSILEQKQKLNTFTLSKQNLGFRI